MNIITAKSKLVDTFFKYLDDLNLVSKPHLYNEKAIRIANNNFYITYYNDNECYFLGDFIDHMVVFFGLPPEETFQLIVKWVEDRFGINIIAPYSDYFKL